MLRSYAHYLRQIGTPYTQRYVEQVLCSHPRAHRRPGAAVRGAVRPGPVHPARGRAAGPPRPSGSRPAITAALDAVTSLDADRILRTLLSVILATARTNDYRLDERGQPARLPVGQARPAPRCPACPKPVPAHEIWVYSPRLEGVHLRFGDVARGGLRWSDRPEDFRTEILGLVKAQEVKNAVIVPVGAKGGFVVKRPPAPTGDPQVDREQQLAEGVACYRMFIAGLLDLTDNRHVGADRAAGPGGPPRRRRLLPGGRRRQGHRHLLRHRQRCRPRLRLLAGRRVRLRRQRRLRPQGHGHHRPRGLGIGEAPLPRTRRGHPGAGLHLRRRRRHVRRRLRQRHAAVPAHPSWSPRSTTGTSSSTRPRTSASRSSSGCGCSSCRARPGRTTTRR